MSNQNFSYQTRPPWNPASARRPRLLSRAQFIDFIAPRLAEDHSSLSYDVAPCDCGDVNCHGWRVIERESPAASGTPRPARIPTEAPGVVTQPVIARPSLSARRATRMNGGPVW